MNGDSSGAPAALFCHINREMGSPQWADAGMYPQQMAWATHHKTVAEVLSLRTSSAPSAVCRSGSKTARQMTRVGRAPLGEMVAFMDGLYTFVSQPITAPFLAAPTAWLIWHISYVISTKGVS
ncbi:hypothetical protein [Streptomyces sp. NPDC001948]